MNNVFTDSLEIPKDAVVFFVEEYGAKGDGVTDDGKAIQAALKAALTLPEETYKVIQLKADTAYRIETVIPAFLGGRVVYSLFLLDGVKNLMILGDNTTLLMKAPNKVLIFENSINVKMAGVHVDYSPKPFVLGRVVDIGLSEGTMDFELLNASDLGFVGGKYTPKDKDYFAFPNEEFGRNNYFIAEYVNLGNGIYRVRLEDRSKYRITTPQIGDEFILPYVDNAHNTGMSFEISRCSGIGIYDMNIYSLPHFAFLVYANYGEVHFRDVHFTMEKNGGIQLVSWRDGFHVKDNTAVVTWDSCTFDPIGDDCFNFSSVVCTITEVVDPRTVNIAPSERMLVQHFTAGDELIIYDPQTGEKIGDSKIVEYRINDTYDAGTLVLADELEGLQTGQTIGFYYSNNPGLIVRNCRINGTFRVRMPALFENCRIQALWCFIGNETEIEGPVPKNITFRGCDFTGSLPGSLDINTISARSNMVEYKCQNIVFEQCQLPEGVFSRNKDNGHGVLIR